MNNPTIEALTEVKKTRRDLDQVKMELEETVQNLADMKNTLANERQTTDNLIKREKDYKERNDRLATELEKLQLRLQNIDAQHAR